MAQAPEEKLDDLHGTLADHLAARIKSGEATAADLAVAVRFLKDNGIAVKPGTSKRITTLADSLPFQDDDDDTVVPFPIAK